MLLGILRHEAMMMLRRKSLWIAYAALYVLYGSILFTAARRGGMRFMDPNNVWASAGRFVFQFNIFMTLVAGILAADTLQRDQRTGMTELHRSAPLRHWTYILGKYLGVLAALLAPYLLWVVIFSTGVLALGFAPVAIFPSMLAAFVSMAMPAYAFVIAFSMACPIVLPVRVYQILFTGYWFWGNYLSPAMLPTLNGTLITPSGMFVLQAFFGGFRWIDGAQRTQFEACLNIAVLLSTVALVFFILERYFVRRDRKA